MQAKASNQLLLASKEERLALEIGKQRGRQGKLAAQAEEQRQVLCRLHEERRRALLVESEGGPRGLDDVAAKWGAGRGERELRCRCRRTSACWRALRTRD